MEVGLGTRLNKAIGKAIDMAIDMGAVLQMAVATL
jgi:hypothetical protein